ncbi:MAG TPA: hypothetical protein VHG28_22175 [Longimicrobiaceae bacterium]|nr:hypothetical protein [Longimicrobiaceae bacterium]
MRALPSLGLIALLAACAVQPAYRAEGPYPSDSPYGAPLRARILSVDGRLRVSTSRPAHTAIFEIVPGQGVGLLYPAYRWEDNYLSGGVNALWISQTRPYYPYFQSAPSTFSRRGVPRYLYMIASDAPLRLSRFIESPGLLRRSLGIAQFASVNPYSILDQLAGLVLPFDEPGEWTDDLFVIWPEQYYDTRYPAAQWLRVQCPDGRIVSGPAYYVLAACDATRNVPPLRTNPREPGQPGDTTQVQEPTRKRPEPRGTEPGSSTEGGTRIAPRAPIIEVVPEPTERIRPTPEERRGPAERRSAEWARISERNEGAPRGAESRDDPRVESRPETHEEPRIEARPEPRVEPRQEPRAEPRQEPRFEPRPEPRIEPRPEPRETPRVESPPGPRVESSPRVEAPRPEPPAPPQP